MADPSPNAFRQVQERAVKCPYCNHPETRVTDSRVAEEGIRRRRECLNCGVRFTTYERVQTTALVVAKRDGRREEFRRDKLLAGIVKAAAKRPIPMKELERIVDEIEAELQRLGHAEIPSSRLGEMVMERLKRLDPVAYIRFASVYMDFKDIDSFEQAVKELRSQAAETLPQAEAQLSFLPPAANGSTPRRRGRRPRVVRQVNVGTDGKDSAQEQNS